MATIHCTDRIRNLWPRPLAQRWKEQYPNLFDVDDLRLTRHQGRNHFCEWFAAIHLFHSRGVLSLVEKYRRVASHLYKKDAFKKLLSAERREILDDVCGSCAVQPPDLLVYMPDFRKFWFAEVKGPNDRLSDEQARSHVAIRKHLKHLKVPVEIIDVRVHETA